MLRSLYPHHRNLLAILGLTCVVVTLVWIWYTPHMSPVEFLTYRRAAQALYAGHSPYPKVHSSALIGGHAYVYPLLTALTMIPISLLPLHLGIDLYRLGEVAALLGSGYLLRGRLGLGIMVLALWSTSGITAIQVGSLEPFFLLALAIAWRFRHHRVLSGVLFGAVGVAKLYLLGVVGTLGLWRAKTSWWWSVATIVVFFPITLLFLPGLSHYLGILHVLSRHEASAGWSFDGVLYRTVHSMAIAEILGAVVGSAAFIGLCLRIASDRLYGSERQLSDLWVTVLICLVVSPITWSHYFVMAFGVFLALGSLRGAMFATVISWIAETPDLVSASGRVTGLLVTVLLSGVLYWILRKDVTHTKGIRVVQRHPHVLRSTSPWVYPWVFRLCIALVAVSAVAVGVIGVVDPSSQPASFIQLLNLGGIAWYLWSVSAQGDDQEVTEGDNEAIMPQMDRLHQGESSNKGQPVDFVGVVGKTDDRLVTGDLNSP